ncbi:OLC1v1015914C1 [Oldenlandia corymbosa var. corymbosa]|uniref:OLC1v1015914C1 n=1 Tax=Oldenlandia corymbosa var. corymbosa TaxID=529605 RepID=A0AAV1E4Q8_OLDCO|nr:OLC1v1015914C1 [Oldenlandia corymbosa var. corymbosa]
MVRPSTPRNSKELPNPNGYCDLMEFEKLNMKNNEAIEGYTMGAEFGKRAIREQGQSDPPDPLPIQPMEVQPKLMEAAGLMLQPAKLPDRAEIKGMENPPDTIMQDSNALASLQGS